MTRVLTASDRALLVEVADLDAAMRLQATLTADPPPGVVELVPAARTVLVRFDPRIVSAGALGARLAAAASPGAAAAGQSGAPAVVEIPVVYDGADLAEVSARLGVGADELVARHVAATWRVAFTGFAPGFGYLVGDDPLFDVPRRASPRTRIPAGSVALGGAFAGVYPRASPGGWQLIGRTDAVMWDVRRDPPALLVPGGRVRFVRVAAAAVVPTHNAVARVAAAAAPAVPAAQAVEVVAPGVQLTLQDEGRAGRAALGVSPSGAADRGALHRANRAVGNAPGEAALEVAVGGAVLRFGGLGVVALAGATLPAAIVRHDGSALDLAPEQPAGVCAGDELRLGFATAGVRAVIAFRGGFAVEPVLGSLSSDTLGGISAGPALRPGATLTLRGPAAAPYAVDPGAVPPAAPPAPGEAIELRITLGPRDDWFTPAGMRALFDQEWTVTPRSDRVGVRLHGPTPLERATPGELPSEGVVTGAIQVPADGQPVLFLPDHPITGGYPVIGAVVDADLDLAGQLPPGARVRFRLSEPIVGGPS